MCGKYVTSLECSLRDLENPEHSAVHSPHRRVDLITLVIVNYLLRWIELRLQYKKNEHVQEWLFHLSSGFDYVGLIVRQF